MLGLAFGFTSRELGAYASSLLEQDETGAAERGVKDYIHTKYGPTLYFYMWGLAPDTPTLSIVK